MRGAGSTHAVQVGSGARRHMQHMQHKQHMVLAVFLFKDTVACSTQ